MLQHKYNRSFFNGSLNSSSWRKIFIDKSWFLYFDTEYYEKQKLGTSHHDNYHVIEKERDDWCDENIGFNSWHSYNSFWFAFESSADVLAFKLMWT